MKKTILLAAALAIYCSAAFVACKKSDSPAPAASTPHASTTGTNTMQGHCDCRTGLDVGTGQPCTCKLEE